MYLGTFEICVLNYMNLIPLVSLNAPGLAWPAALKKTEEKGIRGGICHSIYRYANYDKIKEPQCLQYWDVNNSYGWAMSQKLAVSKCKQIEDTFQFNEDSIKNYNEKSNEGYFLEVDIQNILKNYVNFIMIFSFCLRG